MAGCDRKYALKGDEKKIADEIRSRVKKELGITVSIGISWNKIFAKLGSDYKNQMRSPNFIKKITRVSSGIFLQLTFCMSEDLPERC